MLAVVPNGVVTHTGPLSASVGTDAMMYSLCQFPDSTVAATGPPAPVKYTLPFPSRSPKDRPSKMTVLPGSPLGFDTPLTTMSSGPTALYARVASLDSLLALRTDTSYTSLSTSPSGA